MAMIVIRMPLLLLDEFTNASLQTNGCAGYKEVYRQNQLISVGCWDHTLRKFRVAKDGQPKAMRAKLSKADMALCIINKL